MPDIYNVNPNNIVGGPGRLVFKAYDGTFPDSIAEVMDLTSPYKLKAGWRDLGATTDGISVSRGFDTDDFTVDQVSGPVDTEITEWSHSLETTLAENTVENRQLALAGGEIIETPSVLGTSTTTVGALANGATLVNVTDVTGFTVGGYLELKGRSHQVSAVSGSTLTITPAVKESIAAGTSIAPITELGTRRIGYGTMTEIPFHTYALISQKKDGTLYMAVFRKCKITGDDKEQTFAKEKRTLPLSLNAFADGDAKQTENVYYEIEQVL